MSNPNLVRKVSDSPTGGSGEISAASAIATANKLKNYIINGDQKIDQRNSGAAISAANIANGTYLVDRWKALITQTNKFNAGQNQLGFATPDGFSKYFNINSITAYALLTTDYFTYTQVIEGLNMADLAWGTSSAKDITVSFWVRSSIAGTHGGSAQAQTGTAKSYPFTYTITTANTWEYKTVTITGPTFGTWPSDASIGMYLHFGLGAGATFSGTAGSWSSGNYLSATGAVSIVSTNGANWNITGVMVNQGTTAAPFRLFANGYHEEFDVCQRHWLRISFAKCTGWLRDGTDDYATDAVWFPVTMRATPTATASPASSYVLHVPNEISVNPNTVVPSSVGTQTFYFTGTATNALGAPVRVMEFSGGATTFDAEL